MAGYELGQKVSEVLIVDACHNRYPSEFTTSLFYPDYAWHFQCYPKAARGRGARTPILACRLLKTYLILPRTCFISQGALRSSRRLPRDAS